MGSIDMRITGKNLSKRDRKYQWNWETGDRQTPPYISCIYLRTIETTNRRVTLY